MSIGIDIGGTKINAIRVEEGNIVKSTHVETDKSSPQAFIAQLKELINQVGDDLPIGIGIAGQLDTKNGYLFFAPNIGFKDLPIKNLIGLPHVYLLNDVRAAGFAEWRFGQGVAVNNFITVFLGTGIGGMLVTNGQVIEGVQNFAGEIGHITIDYKGSPCTCGSIGCIETISSGWGIAKRGQVKEAKSIFQNGPSPLLEDAITGLIFLIKSLVNLQNPEKVIIGGGLLKGYLAAYPDFLERLEMGVKNEALKSYEINIVTSTLGDNSGALGASAFALESFKQWQ